MYRLAQPLARLFFWASALIGVVGVAQASMLGVSPLRVDLSDRRPTAAVTVQNGGNAAMVVQLQVMRWSAIGEEDRYEPVDDIIASPPIMTIGPGASQIVRVGLGGAPDPRSELAYRLYLEEVPPPPGPGYQGLQVALRISIPVFVAPGAPAQADVRWRAKRSGASALTILATNDGNAHMRLLNLAVHAPGSEDVLAERRIVGYLLPGQSRQWAVELRAAPDGAPVRLILETDAGTTEVDVEVDNP